MSNCLRHRRRTPSWTPWPNPTTTRHRASASAAGFFAGAFVPSALREEARQVAIPLLFLLQWDDEGNDRVLALDLLDAFGSREKTLHANLGGHAGPRDSRWPTGTGEVHEHVAEVVEPAGGHGWLRPSSSQAVWRCRANISRARVRSLMVRTSRRS
jgi:hypothetical protein